MGMRAECELEAIISDLNGTHLQEVKGCLHEGRKGLHAEISVRVMSQKRRLEKELEMAGDKNRSEIWAPLLSLLALITTFQKNYHNYQLVPTPNEMAGRY